MTWFTKGLRPVNSGCSLSAARSVEGNDLIYEGITTRRISHVRIFRKSIPKEMTWFTKGLRPFALSGPLMLGASGKEMTWFTKGLRLLLPLVLLLLFFNMKEMTWFTKGLRQQPRACRIYCPLDAKEMTWFTKGLRLSLFRSDRVQTEYRRKWPDLRRDYDYRLRSRYHCPGVPEGNDLIYEGITTWS